MFNCVGQSCFEPWCQTGDARRKGAEHKNAHARFGSMKIVDEPVESPTVRLSDRGAALEQVTYGDLPPLYFSSFAHDGSS